MPSVSGPRFADNFARMLGVHRLSAKRAAELLGISKASVSYWLNGHREPDRNSLWDISIFFLVDPWEIMEAPARDFVRTLADERRFDWVEKQIADGVTAAELERRHRRPAGGPGLGRLGDLEQLADAIAHTGEERVSAPAGELRKLQPVRDEVEE